MKLVKIAAAGLLATVCLPATIAADRPRRSGPCVLLVQANGLVPVNGSNRARGG